MTPTNITIEYAQTGAGTPEGGKTGKLSQRDGTLDPRLLLPCANPDCKKGGFLLRPAVDRLVKDGKAEQEIEVRCAGYVGALRTERGPAQPCANVLRATVRVAYGARPPESR